MDASLVRLLSDSLVSREILGVLLDLVAFFDKEKRELPAPVSDAAKKCALTKFRGELHQGLPATVLWYAEQETADNLTTENIAENLVEVNIRFVDIT